MVVELNGGYITVRLTPVLAQNFRGNFKLILKLPLIIEIFNQF